ncbi:MAG: deoxyguanosinetriphosphate triphosphohydrolase [Caldiserica bacterium]|jgi:dGTPase|nr:deoxyguanosinetriphosphate triphosphohydrolase [Caldisericota bacterium]
MLIRERQEELEEKILSPFAALANKTRGRQRPEPECPIRTAFQRDRDRIIHSKAFRRLKHKTQVYTDPTGDHYRTRLTHTLEVSQIARTIARALRLNEDLTEAIALGHDLGHPPFGHAGEEALDSALRAVDPGLHFFHPEQSLRVVDFLEKQKNADGTEEVGLNLTWEVRDGILHHSKGESQIDLSGPSTLEGQIVKLADRVAYLNHDIDDALRAGTLTPKELPFQRIFGYGASELIDVVVKDVVEQSEGQDQILISPQIREMLDQLKNFLFQEVYRDPEAKREEDKVRRMICTLFNFYLEHPETLPQPPLESFGRLSLAQAVVDYIAGMTDRFAVKTFSQYYLPQPW